MAGFEPDPAQSEAPRLIFEVPHEDAPHAETARFGQHQKALYLAIFGLFYKRDAAQRLAIAPGHEEMRALGYKLFRLKREAFLGREGSAHGGIGSGDQGAPVIGEGGFFGNRDHRGCSPSLMAKPLRRRME